MIDVPINFNVQSSLVNPLSVRPPNTVMPGVATPNFGNDGTNVQSTTKDIPWYTLKMNTNGKQKHI